MSKRSPGPALFKVGGIWHVRFQRGGKRIQRSTHETVRSKAEELAWRMYNGAGPIPTLAVLARMWLDVHESTSSAEHIRNVEDFTRNHLYDLATLRIDRIRTEDVEAARARHLQTRAPSSANLWLRILKLICNWAVRRDLITKVPWKVSMLKLQKIPHATLPTTKASAWLQHVDQVCGERWGIATAIRLMLGLGLRESEALSARWEWIDWERRTYTPGKTKGKEAAPVPMPDWVLAHLTDSRGPDRPIFPPTAGLISVSPRGGSYSKGMTRRVILKANALAGVTRLTPHRLRGTYATLLSEAGVPIQDIQLVMRHKDSRTTMGYLEVDLDRAAKAQEAIARRMGFKWRKNGEAGEASPSE